MSNRPYKNVKRFVDDISKDVKKGMKGENLITVVKVANDVDLLGKHANDLMTSFVVDEGTDTIIATLPYVEGYTGFSSLVEEQEGNYLVFKTITGLKDATIKIKAQSKTVTLDEDGILILRIREKNPNITITVKNTTESLSKTYATNLTLGTKE